MTRAWLAALAMTLAAQLPPPRLPGGQQGPWNNDIDVYRVSTSGEAKKLTTFERAGVSNVVRLRDGRLVAIHQHFPADNAADFDKVAVHFSSDEGAAWTAPRVIGLKGLPDGMRFPFDPTLVPLPDGRVRLYFTSTRGQRIEEHLPAIYSAISSDGVDFTVEPGRRFGIEGRPVIDCAVVLHKGVFHLYAPDNGERLGPGAPRPDGVGYHATSADGLTFTRAEDVKIDGRRHWLGAAVSEGDTITFFGTGQGVWTATSRDGQSWKEDQTLRVQGADPGAVKLGDGSWLLTVTGPPRRNEPGRPGGFAGGVPDVTRELTEIERRLAATWKAGDCEGWSAMIAPEWSVIQITGETITRAAAMERCRKPASPIESFEVDEVSVRFFGDSAVVTGRTRIAVGGTTPTRVALRFTDVFVRRDGRWIAVASHATRLAQ